jgi:NAD(P)-dependent dehydrogenase (short-subunit alcohol dehydrogenase family)
VEYDDMAGERLSGKVAVVTGAAGGIGGAVVRAFAQAGAEVVGVDREQADLSRAADVEAVFRAVEDEQGRLDILFNGAGISGRRFGDGPVHEATEEAWDAVLAVNLKSVFLCCRRAVPLMLERGGSIVNLASVLALVGGDEDFATHAYAASKGGIVALTRAIAVTYAARGIRCNAVAPGLIATPMSARAQADPGIRARLPELQPLTGDFGRPDDVAAAAVYLAGDESRFVTGTVLPVDGGWTAR